MTRDEIIKMAQEAGFREPNPHDGFMGLAYNYRDGTDTGASLERFAALVAAAEREACAKVCYEESRRCSTLAARSRLMEAAVAIRARSQQA